MLRVSGVGANGTIKHGYTKPAVKSPVFTPASTQVILELLLLCSPALCSLSYQSLVDTECHILMTKVHLPSKMFRITRDVINVQCTKSLIDTEMFSQYSSSAVTETYIVLFTNQHKNTKIQYVQKKQLIILNSFQNNKHKI